MDAREQKGLEIAATMNLEKQADGMWSVPSQAGRGRYAVDAEDEATAPARITSPRQLPCKHVFAVETA